MNLTLMDIDVCPRVCDEAKVSAAQRRHKTFPPHLLLWFSNIKLDPSISITFLSDHFRLGRLAGNNLPRSKSILLRERQNFVYMIPNLPLMTVTSHVRLGLYQIGPRKKFTKVFSRRWAICRSFLLQTSNMDNKGTCPTPPAPSLEL